MFEPLHLLGPSERDIPLYTAKRLSIENLVAPSPTDAHRHQYKLFRQQHSRSDWQNRKPATGVYNCFGHVFAARRTSIYKEPEVQRILVEDGYRKLNVGDQPVADDIVLYRHRESAVGILHVGRLVPVHSGDVSALRVVSKWNDRFGEDIHHIKKHPYAESDVRIEIWTDRPLKT